MSLGPRRHPGATMATLAAGLRPCGYGRRVIPIWGSHGGLWVVCPFLADSKCTSPGPGRGFNFGKLNTPQIGALVPEAPGAWQGPPWAQQGALVINLRALLKTASAPFGGRRSKIPEFHFVDLNSFIEV